MLRRILCTMLLTALCAARATATATVGIVLLHGLNGVPLGEPSPNGVTVGGGLIAALRKAGYLVATPEMCFSHRRVFDRTFAGCFADVDATIAALRSQGASTIVVGGESLGGLMAVGYAAERTGIAGVIACAPGGDAERLVHNPAIASALAGAQADIAAGRGDAVRSFPESNTGPKGHYEFSVRTTPHIYVSFVDPDGPANLEAEVARVSIPLLWVAGTRDGTQPASAPGVLNSDPRTQFVSVDADHLGTPDAGTDAILAWLRTVVPQN